MFVRDAETDATLVTAFAKEVEISSRVGSIPRRLTFPENSVFETADNDAIDHYVRQRRGLRYGFVHSMEVFHPRLLAIAVAVIALGFAIYHLLLPALVEVAVLVTPPVVPHLMSSSTLAMLDRTVLDPSELDATKRQRISEGFARISERSTGNAATYNLNFRESAVIGPNAFALPDGTIIITDELVRLAGDDDEMIIGVLAHEIGHVELKHSLRQLYRAAGVAGLVMLIAGDVGSSIEDILTQGGGLLALSYSRAAESEADRRSVDLMREAGRDPTAIARFFTLLETRFADRGHTTILATHPGTPERRQAILDYAAGSAN